MQIRHGAGIGVARKMNLTSLSKLLRLIGVILIVGYYSAGCTHVIATSAQAFVWVAPNDRTIFIDEIETYAKKHSLIFSVRTVPGPWHMDDIELMTPRRNEITIFNATDGNKYFVGITIYNAKENWRHYWADLRAYISIKYKWKDA